MTLPFTPAWGSNVIVTLVAGTEQHFVVSKDSRTIRVINTGATNPVYFRTYNSGTTGQVIAATIKDMRVNPSSSTLINYASADDTISLLSPAGTTVEFMVGVDGI